MDFLYQFLGCKVFLFTNSLSLCVVTQAHVATICLETWIISLGLWIKNSASYCSCTLFSGMLCHSPKKLSIWRLCLLVIVSLIKKHGKVNKNNIYSKSTTTIKFINNEHLTNINYNCNWWKIDQQLKQVIPPLVSKIYTSDNFYWNLVALAIKIFVSLQQFMVKSWKLIMVDWHLSELLVKIDIFKDIWRPEKYSV